MFKQASVRGCLKSPDSRQILSSMCSLQLPDSWHEAYTTFCELGIGRTFQTSSKPEDNPVAGTQTWGKPNTRVTSRKVGHCFGRNLVTAHIPKVKILMTLLMLILLAGNAYYFFLPGANIGVTVVGTAASLMGIWVIWRK